MNDSHWHWIHIERTPDEAPGRRIAVGPPDGEGAAYAAARERADRVRGPGAVVTAWWDTPPVPVVRHTIGVLTCEGDCDAVVARYVAQWLDAEQ